MRHAVFAPLANSRAIEPGREGRLKSDETALRLFTQRRLPSVKKTSSYVDWLTTCLEGVLPEQSKHRISVPHERNLVSNGSREASLFVEMPQEEAFPYE